ncbi:MAG: MBL fold metallo-hydrolase [Gemmatimonadota bacterium]|nr:MBL fold metallo-hydrolase [Gemmatimonadota bacterium]
MLGTGTPNADPDRSGPAIAVVSGGQAYLVDAGPGIVRRAAAAVREGVTALRMPKLDLVFLTHLHSDHTLGLPDLMLSPWVLDRTAPLRVYGPPGTANMVRFIDSAYAKDIDLRLHGGEPTNATGWRTTVREIIDTGVVYQDSNMTVRAFRVRHGAWDYAYGYRFEARDRTIVVSGDTRPTDAVVDACRGCDVLVHEVYDAETFKRRPAAWQAYHARYHTSTYELGALAARARPRLLLLVHQLYWGGTDADLVRQVATRFTGRIVSAHDLGIY